MSSESNAPVCIVCVPTSGVAAEVQKRVEQMGMPFYIIPVDPHNTSLHLLESTSCVLVALCPEMQIIRPIKLLTMLIQQNVRLLPLGRDDARSIWRALSFEGEKELKEIPVYQLDDYWEKELSHKSTLAHYQLSSHTLVNRETPMLRNPLVDLDEPEPLQDDHLNIPPSLAPAWWLYFLLCASVAILGVSLWLLSFSSQKRTMPYEETGELSEQQMNLIVEEQPSLPQQANTANEGEGIEPYAHPAATVGEDSDVNPQLSCKSDSLLSRNDCIEPTPGESMSVFEMPAHIGETRRDTPVISADHDEKIGLSISIDEAISETSQQMTVSSVVTEQHEEKTPVQPRVIDKKVPKTRAGVPPENPALALKQTQTSKPHYCPSDGEVRKARLGSRIGRYIEAGAEAGCAKCQANLEYLKKR